MSHANTLNGGTVLGADGSVMLGVAAQKAVLTGSLGGGAAIMAGGNPVDAFSIGFGASMLGTGIEKFNYEYLPEGQNHLGGPDTELKPDDHPHVTGLEVSCHACQLDTSIAFLLGNPKPLLSSILSLFFS